MASLFAKAMTKASKDFKAAFLTAEEAAKSWKMAFPSPQLTRLFSGFDYNRIHQIYGPPSAGKSTLCTYIASQMQKAFPDKGVVYIDFEHAFNGAHARQMGLDLSEDHFQLIQPLTIEEAFTAVFSIFEDVTNKDDNPVCCLIIDSDAEAPTKTETEDEVNKANYGDQAKALGRVLRRLNPLCSRYKFPVLWISQERVNMKFGAKLPSVTGGEAPKFYASTRNRVTLDGLGQIIDKATGEVIGIQIVVKNYKNKTGVPFRKANMQLYYKGGFKSDDEYTQFFIDYGYIQKSGGWYTGEAIGMPKLQGIDAVTAWLRDAGDVVVDLRKKVDARLTEFDADLDKNNVDENTEEDKAIYAGATGVQSDEEIEAEAKERISKTKSRKANTDNVDASALAARALAEAQGITVEE